MAPTEQKAVIDRIEDNTWAVLLIGQEQTEKIIPVEQLPQDAKEGTWLRLRLEEDTIREIIVDAEATTALRSRLASKLDQLRSRQRHFQPINEADQQKSAPKEPEEPPAKPLEQDDDPLDLEWYE